jgi:hemolysin III
MHESFLGQRGPRRPDQSRQEWANSLTHGLMALLALASLGPLIIAAARHGSVRHIVSFSIFGSALVLLFLASALMHSKNLQGLHKRVYDFLDYAGIYLVIAATYTPFCLVTLHGALGWTLFGVVWGLAGTGTLLSLFIGEKFDRYAILIYLAMGWLVIVALRPLAVGLQAGGLALLIGGGVAYTVGVVVLVTDRLLYSHAIWHLFVGLGAFLHLLAMLFYVLPDTH